MTPPVSAAVLIKLVKGYSLAHPNETAEEAAARAHRLITSLRSVGLDIVVQDNPIELPEAMPTDQGWDPLVAGMRRIYEQSKHRTPWRP